MNIEMKWRPIETAPKDRTIDLWVIDERIHDCWWGQPTYSQGKALGFVYQSSYDSDGPVISLVHGATHWMPLPPSPAEQYALDQQETALSERMNPEHEQLSEDLG